MALVERYTQSQQAAQRSASAPCAAAKPEEIQHAVLGVKPPRTCISLAQSAVRATHVGILAMEVYFPAVYVRSLLNPATLAQKALFPRRVFDT